MVQFAYPYNNNDNIVFPKQYLHMVHIEYMQKKTRPRSTVYTYIITDSAAIDSELVGSIDN